MLDPRSCQESLRGWLWATLPEAHRCVTAACLAVHGLDEHQGEISASRNPPSQMVLAPDPPDKDDCTERILWLLCLSRFWGVSSLANAASSSEVAMHQLPSLPQWFAYLCKTDAASARYCETVELADARLQAAL